MLKKILSYFKTNQIAFAIVFFVIIGLTMRTLYRDGSVHNARPITDNFLELLKNENYEQLYVKYFKDFGVSRETFDKKNKERQEIFGKLIDYKYSSTRSYGKNAFGDVNTYCLNYKVKFNTGKRNTCFIEVDSPENGKIRIIALDISASVFENRGFSIRFLNGNKM